MLLSSGETMPKRADDPTEGDDKGDFEQSHKLEYRPAASDESGRPRPFATRKDLKEFVLVFGAELFVSVLLPIIVLLVVLRFGCR